MVKAQLPIISDYFPTQTLYETRFKYYLIAADATKERHRVLKIDKHPTCFSLSGDSTAEYSRKQVNSLLRDLAASHEGHGGCHQVGGTGVNFVGGIVGAVRFTKCYYLILVTRSRCVGTIGPHTVHEVSDIRLVPLHTEGDATAYTADALLHSLQKDDEARYRKIFGDMDLRKEFYFCHTYDLSNTLQSSLLNRGGTLPRNDTFVANHVMLQPLVSGGAHPAFLLPLMHGFFCQAVLSVFGRRVPMVLLCRRSRQYGGTRFMKRGMNDAGFVANHLEVEQIVYDASSLSLGETTGSFTSYVQVRGSVPVFWSQTMDHKKTKPAVRIGRNDMNCLSAKRHFAQLFSRYGSPIIVLDLLQQKEKKKRESLLSELFDSSIDEMRRSLPPNAEIQYIPWDLRGASRIHREKVVNDMAAISEDALLSTGFFHVEAASRSITLQSGVVRTNCLDCLDRTNLAMLFINKTALGRQLQALGVLASEADIIHYPGIVNTLVLLHVRLGDSIAQQYTGSRAVSNGVLKRHMFEDLFINMKRFYSNHMTDAEKQKSINLFLGVYACHACPSTEDKWQWSIPPSPEYIDRMLLVTTSSDQSHPTDGGKEVEIRRLNLWDIESDYYLHMNLGGGESEQQDLGLDDTTDESLWCCDALMSYRRMNPTLVSLPAVPNAVAQRLCEDCLHFRGMYMPETAATLSRKVPESATTSESSWHYRNHVLALSGGMGSESPIQNLLIQTQRIPIDEGDRQLFPCLTPDMQESPSEYFVGITPMQQYLRHTTCDKAETRKSLLPMGMAPLNLQSSEVRPTLDVSRENEQMYESYVNTYSIREWTQEEFIGNMRRSEYFHMQKRQKTQTFTIPERSVLDSYILGGVDKVEAWNVDETARILSSLGVGHEAVLALRIAHVDGTQLSTISDFGLTNLGVRAVKEQRRIREVLRQKASLDTIDLSSTTGEFCPRDDTSDELTHKRECHREFSDHFLKVVPERAIEGVVASLEMLTSCKRCGIPTADRPRRTHSLGQALPQPGLGELPELVGGEIIPRTMLGSHAVSWVVANSSRMGLKCGTAPSDEQQRVGACSFLNTLLKGGFMTQVSPSLFVGDRTRTQCLHTIEDSRFVLYRLMSDERMYVMNMAAMSRSRGGSHLHAPLQLAELLLSMALDILRLYSNISEIGDNKAGALAEILRSPTFSILRDNVAELQFVDLSTLQETDKTAFFVNVFNVLYIHGYVGLCTEIHLPYSVFIHRCAYIVGTNVLSLADIKHGILRGNRPYGERLLPCFTKNDSRCKLSVANVDYRVHFVLVDAFLSETMSSSSEQAPPAPSNNGERRNSTTSHVPPPPVSTTKRDGLTGAPGGGGGGGVEDGSSDDDSETATLDGTQHTQRMTVGKKSHIRNGSEDASGGGLFGRGLWTTAAVTKPPSTAATSQLQQSVKIMLPHTLRAQLHAAAAKYLHSVIDTSKCEVTNIVVLPQLFAEYPEDFGARKEDWVKLCSRYVSRNDVRRISKVSTVRFANISPL